MPWCQLQFFFFLWNFICLKGRERTEPEISGLLLFPQMPVLAGVKARNQELIPGLQYGWEGSKYLQHHLLALRMCISNKLVSEVEPGHRPRLSNRDMGIPGGVFTVVPSADSYCLFFPPCWPHQIWMEFLIKNLIHWGIALNTWGGVQNVQVLEIKHKLTFTCESNFSISNFITTVSVSLCHRFFFSWIGKEMCFIGIDCMFILVNM